MMDELERILIGNSAAAPAAQIVEGVSDELAHREVAGVPRTIYEELWHIAFWLQVTLEWNDGIETPYPEHASEGFPSAADIEKESWPELCRRFL
jgi:DinB superfamily